MLTNGQFLLQDVKLLTYTHFESDLFHFISDVLPLNVSSPLRRALHASQNVKSGSLACTIVAQNTKDLVVLDAQ